MLNTPSPTPSALQTVGAICWPFGNGAHPLTLLAQWATSQKQPSLGRPVMSSLCSTPSACMMIPHVMHAQGQTHPWSPRPCHPACSRTSSRQISTATSVRTPPSWRASRRCGRAASRAALTARTWRQVSPTPEQNLGIWGCGQTFLCCQDSGNSQTPLLVSPPAL